MAKLTDQEVRRLEIRVDRAAKAISSLERAYRYRATLAKAQAQAEAAESELEWQRADHRSRLGQAGGQRSTDANTSRFDREITQRDIETLALRAVMRFARLPAAEADPAWQLWRQELKRRLPTLVAEEVLRRAEALRKLG